MDRGSKLSRNYRIFSSPKRPDQLRGPTSLIFKGYRGSSQTVKQIGCEINKIKIKVTPEQATKFQRGSKGIALLFP